MSLTGISIGNFDGVHLGHQSLFERLKSQPCSHLVALGFQPHPREVLTGARVHKISTLAQQKKKFIELGVSLDSINFTAELAALDSRQFLEKYIINPYQPNVIGVGHDFRFGSGQQGSFETLQNLSVEFGFEVFSAQPVLYGELPVSSSRIREALLLGNLVAANSMLGREYSVLGQVVHGEKLGRKIGSPTANIDSHNDYLLPNGVYATKTKLNEVWLESVTNIGLRPTVGGVSNVSIETHILDFDQDIYGENLEVAFFKSVRAEKKFANTKELVENIAKDIEAVRAYFFQSMAPINDNNN